MSGTRGLAGAYASTFVLTLSNPVTILSFAGIFAGLGLGDAAGAYEPGILLVLGVFAGSAAWWLALTSAVGLLQNRLGEASLRWIHRLSGLILLGFGAYALLSVRL